MKKGHLSSYFTGVAVKRLSTVETTPQRSNQHEFDGVQDLRKLLGGDRATFPATFTYLADDDPEPLREQGFLTWYDARAAHPRRSEYRLYYPTTVVSDNASAGDLLIIARRPDASLLVIVAEAGSTIESQLLWLFGLSDLIHPGFSVKGEIESGQIKLEFAARHILELVGEDVEETDDNQLDRMLKLFGGTFPTTRIFSAYARSTLPGLSALDDPDGAMMRWMEREEVLFRTLEKHIVGERLQHGFACDVEGFIKFSMSVHQRRKSRVGYALENHLEEMFVENGIRFTRGAVTEGKARPDFLLPGVAEYRDTAFDPKLLTMLGVKATCRDRWRQVLPEASRIPDKHLYTMEPSISLAQTSEMAAHRVQLVLPAEVHQTYSTDQRSFILSTVGLLDLVRDREASGELAKVVAAA